MGKYLCGCMGMYKRNPYVYHPFLSLVSTHTHTTFSPIPFVLFKLFVVETHYPYHIYVHIYTHTWAIILSSQSFSCWLHHMENLETSSKPAAYHGNLDQLVMLAQLTALLPYLVSQVYQAFLTSHAQQKFSLK